MPDAGPGLHRRQGRHRSTTWSSPTEAAAGAPVAVDPAQVQPFDVPRDELWPKSVVTWLILSVVFLLLSVQAVSPTRRWRIRRGAAHDAEAEPG